MRVAIRAFHPNPALFLAVLHAETVPDPHQHTPLDRVAVVMENIALTTEAATPADWFTAFVQRLNGELRALPKLPAITAAWCGIAVDQDATTRISCAATGAILVRVLSGDAAHLHITRITEPTSEPATPLLHFDHVLDGIIHTNDVLLVTAPPGTTALPDTTLRPMFAHRPLPEGIDALRRHAEAIRTALGALVLLQGNPPATPPHSHASMESFLETAASTERFLTPKLGPAFREYFRQTHITLAALLQRTPRRLRTATKRTSSHRGTTALQLAVRTIRLALRSGTAMLLDAARIFGVTVARSAIFLTRQGIRLLRTDRRTLIARYAPAQIIRHAHAHAQALRTRYHTLPRSSRILLLLACIFAILFSGSTIALWRRRLGEQEIATYNTTIARIDDLRSNAEARLLFGDRATARVALQDAIGYLATVPTSTRARRERAAVLDRELRAALDRARLLTRLSTPLTIYPSANTPPIGPLGDIALLKQQLVIVAADGGQFALLQPKTNAVTVRAITPKPSLTIFRTLALNDRWLMLLDRQGHGVTVDTQTGAATTVTIEQPPAIILDAFMVRGRLQLLHPNGTITSHARTAAGFGRGTAVLAQTNSSVTSRTSMWMTKTATIIGAGDGTLTEYVNGRRKEVRLLGDVDPPLHTAPTIAASMDGGTIYVGDSTDGRIAAISVVGELIGQIQSDTLRELRRILPHPNGDSLYILHDDTVSAIVPPKPSESH